MPESAEVKLTTEYLKYSLENNVISEWTFLSGQYKDKHPIGFEEFQQNLPLMVESVNCKGKFIYIILYNENGYFYILHSIRMTGRWQEYEDEYCRWKIDLDNGKNIWFGNPRCFATIEFTKKRDILDTHLSRIGPDILTNQFNIYVWNDLLEKYKNKNITCFLMDQSIISGIGNYIKSEALYYSKISPLRKISSLKSHESSKLFEAIRIIPRISYNKNGMSVRDYADEEGNKGTYGDDLKIYAKPNAKKTKTADGRVTYWDPEIQK